MLVGVFSVILIYFKLREGSFPALVWRPDLQPAGRHKSKQNWRRLLLRLPVSVTSSSQWRTVSARWAVITSVTITVMALVTTIIKYDHTSTSTLHTLPPPIERLLTGGRGGGRKMIHLMIQLFFFLRDHCYNSHNSQHNKIFLILKLFYRSELFCFVSLSQSASKSCPTADISPCE